MRKTLFLGLLSVTSLAGAVASCSSTTTVTSDTDGGASSSGTGDGGGKKDGSSSSSSGSSSGDEDTGTSSSSSSGGPDDACLQEKTFDACGQCCAKNHLKGYNTFQDSVIACGCKGTGVDGGKGVCATECAATFCKDPPAQPDTKCNTCLQGSLEADGECSPTVVAACKADSDCSAYQGECLAKCPQK